MIADARPPAAQSLPKPCTDSWSRRPKLGYPTRAEAQRARRAMRRLDQKPYRCECGDYHLGHDRVRK